MEDKHKNKRVLSLPDFIELIKADLNSEDKNNCIVDNIESTLISINENNEISKITYKKDKNITLNTIYFLAFNSDKDYKVVLKIRKEDSPIPYSEEAKFIKKLEIKSLIPKQYLNMSTESQKIKISIEEFINGNHISDKDPYNSEIIEILIRNIAEFNSIGVLENNSCIRNEQEEINNVYLKFLLHKSLQSKKRFSEIINNFTINNNDLAKIYFDENLKTFEKIKKYLDDIPEYYENIMINYSDNKDKLVFSHIDTHTWNFFKVDNKLKYIDFDDLSYCLPGFDLANYFIESEYILNNDKYPFFVHDANHFSDELIIKSFKEYFEILKRESGVEFVEITFDEIFRLICIALIKTVIEFIFMIKDNNYLKDEIDFLLLIGSRISTFEKFYEIITK